MKRKIAGILVAVLLASIGTAALVAYVRSAKERAIVGEERVKVYVVKSNVRKGATMSEIRKAIDLVEIPAKVLAKGAVVDPVQLAEGQVVAIDFLPGEQLLESRLVNADQLTRVEVPRGLQQLTLALDPERAVGGELKAGDTVGVVISFQPFDTNEFVPISGQEGQVEIRQTKTPNTTHLTLHKVLVTGVQFNKDDRTATTTIGIGNSTDSGDAAPVEQAPGNQLLVTLALSSPHVEQVVFGAEFGLVWLTAEDANADESGTRVVTLDEVYGEVSR